MLLWPCPALWESGLLQQQLHAFPALPPPQTDPLQVLLLPSRSPTRFKSRWALAFPVPPSHTWIVSGFSLRNLTLLSPLEWFIFICQELFLHPHRLLPPLPDFLHVPMSHGQMILENRPFHLDLASVCVLYFK